MVILQGVEDGLSLPAEFHQAALLENAELVGNGALGHIEELGDVAYAHLALQKDVEDFDSGGIPEYFKKLRQVIEELFIRHLLCDSINDFRMGVDIIASRGVIIWHHRNLLSGRALFTKQYNVTVHFAHT